MPKSSLTVNIQGKKKNKTNTKHHRTKSQWFLQPYRQNSKSLTSFTTCPSVTFFCKAAWRRWSFSSPSPQILSSGAQHPSWATGTTDIIWLSNRYAATKSPAPLVLTSPFLPCQLKQEACWFLFYPQLQPSDTTGNYYQAARNLVVLSRVGFVNDAQTRKGKFC